MKGLDYLENAITEFMVYQSYRDMTEDEIKEAFISDVLKGSIFPELKDVISNFLFEEMAIKFKQDVGKYVDPTEEDKKKIKVDKYLISVSSNSEMLNDHYNLLGLENHENQTKLDDMKEEDEEQAISNIEKTFEENNMSDLIPFAISEFRNKFKEINYNDIIKNEEELQNQKNDENLSDNEKEKASLMIQKRKLILDVIKSNEEEIATKIAGEMLEQEKADYTDGLFDYLRDEIKEEIDIKSDEVQITSDDVKQHIVNNDYINLISRTIPYDEMENYFISNIPTDNVPKM